MMAGAAFVAGVARMKTFTMTKACLGENYVRIRKLMEGFCVIEKGRSVAYVFKIG